MKYGEEGFLRFVENAMSMPDINCLIDNWCISGYDVDLKIMNTDNTPVNIPVGKMHLSGHVGSNVPVNGKHHWNSLITMHIL